MLRKMKSRS